MFRNRRFHLTRCYLSIMLLPRMIFKTAKVTFAEPIRRVVTFFLNSWETRISPVNVFLARRKMLKIRNTNLFTYEKNNLWFVAVLEHYAKNAPAREGKRISASNLCFHKKCTRSQMAQKFSICLAGLTRASDEDLIRRTRWYFNDYYGCSDMRSSST